MCRRLGTALLLGVVILAVALPAPTHAQGWATVRNSLGALTNMGRQSFANVVQAVQNTTVNLAKDVVRFAVVRTNENEICYRILGCFSLESPWISLKRPLPVPRSPEKINVRFYLYTRNQPERYTLAAAPTFMLNGSDYDGSKMTFFLVHGYLNSGNETWMANLKDAVLGKVDGNVIIVDWGEGAIEPNYLQATSNTRVVGREIGLLGRTLINEYGANARRFHFMGHSLGAHISGYAARNITNVARLTAFDPAGPGFESLPRLVRVNKYSASFVDVLHTNAKPVTALGFGMMHSVGHVDFYMNGGVDQPGCASPEVEQPKSLLDLIKIPITTLAELISCSHSRSYEYFTEAISNTDCRMWGHKVSVARQRLLWRLSRPSPVPLLTGQCSNAQCTPVGLDTPQYPARGAFSVVTNSSSPFCLQANSNDGQTVAELKQLGLVY